MAKHNWVAAFAVLALAAGNGAGAAPDRSAPGTAGVTDTMIAAGAGDEWLSYGGGYDEQRFIPLGLVSDKNVAKLGLAWFADIDTARGQETPEDRWDFDSDAQITVADINVNGARYATTTAAMSPYFCHR